MSDTSVRQEVERRLPVVQAFAAIHRRGNKWPTAERVAKRTGLTIGQSASAIEVLGQENVVERKCSSAPGSFRITTGGRNSYRAELESTRLTGSA